MQSATKDDDRQAIRLLVQRINDAWANGRTGELNEYFHADMVIAGPTFREVGRGRDACVRSYDDFVRSAAVHALVLADPTVEVWGDTAVATSAWEITYEMGGVTSRERGHDLFVLRREEGAWRAVWRGVVPEPERA